MNEISFIGKPNNSEESAEHSHGDFELICFESEGTIVTCGNKMICTAGSVAVIPPLVKHRAECRAAVKVVLDKALLPVKAVTVIPCAEGDDLSEAIRRAARYDGKKNRERELVLSAYGNLVAALVTARVAPKGYSPAVQSVVEDIERHLGDSTYSLEASMRTLPLNYDYVRKLFKSEVGVTPHEYLTRARMQRAKAILLSGVTNRYSEYTVTQIAEACGFPEPLYFSRVFKKYHGVAPSHYLKNL